MSQKKIHLRLKRLVIVELSVEFLMIYFTFYRYSEPSLTKTGVSHPLICIYYTTLPRHSDLLDTDSFTDPLAKQVDKALKD